MADDRVLVSFVVEPDGRGMRLDRYLARRLGGLSRTRVQRLIESALVSERPLKASSVVQPGLRFQIARPRLEEPETPTEMPELHRDDDLLVLDKPAGLPVHPTARYANGTVVGLLRARYGEGFAAPAHRLDRETTGVIVCTRNEAATRRLSLAFERGRVEKHYLAICEGWPDDELVVDAPIAMGGELVRIAVRIDRASGRPSRTRFVVMQRFLRGGERFALLQALPATGRQHQIRVHLREAGYPLVGDKIYGASEAIYDRFTRGALTDDDRRRLRLSRHALHAERIAFAHPGGRGTVAFRAPLPADLSAFLAEAEPSQAKVAISSASGSRCSS